jgi:hypothetical protein
LISIDNLTQLESTKISKNVDEEFFKNTLKKIIFGFFHFIEILKIFTNIKSKSNLFNSEFSSDILEHNKLIIEQMVNCPNSKNLQFFFNKLKINTQKFSDDLNLLIQNIDFEAFHQIIDPIESNYDLLYSTKKDVLVQLDLGTTKLDFGCNSDQIKNILSLKFKRKDELLISYWRALRKNIIENFRTQNSLPKRLPQKILISHFLKSYQINDTSVHQIFLSNKISMKHIGDLYNNSKLMKICRAHTNRQFFIDQINHKTINQFDLFVNQINCSKYNLDLVMKNSIRFPWNINEITNSLAFFY